MPARSGPPGAPGRADGDGPHDMAMPWPARLFVTECAVSEPRYPIEDELAQAGIRGLPEPRRDEYSVPELYPLERLPAGPRQLVEATLAGWIESLYAEVMPLLGEEGRGRLAAIREAHRPAGFLALDFAHEDPAASDIGSVRAIREVLDAIRAQRFPGTTREAQRYAVAFQRELAAMQVRVFGRVPSRDAVSDPESDVPLVVQLDALAGVLASGIVLHAARHATAGATPVALPSREAPHATPPSPHELRDGALLEHVGAPEARIARPRILYLFGRFPLRRNDQEYWIVAARRGSSVRARYAPNAVGSVLWLIARARADGRRALTREEIEVELDDGNASRAMNGLRGILRALGAPELPRGRAEEYSFAVLWPVEHVDG